MNKKSFCTGKFMWYPSDAKFFALKPCVLFSKCKCESISVTLKMVLTVPQRVFAVESYLKTNPWNECGWLVA